MKTKFRGAYEAVLDATKGRISLPSAIRKMLPENFDGCFFMNTRPEGCIVVYMKETWDPIMDEVDKMEPLDQETWDYQMYMNSAIGVEKDSQDRVSIPKNFLEHANISKNIKVAGKGDYFELWDEGRYNEIITRISNPDYQKKLVYEVPRKYAEQQKNLKEDRDE